MAVRTKFEASDDVGCFMKLTNSFCLVSADGPDHVYDSLQNDMGQLPVVAITIAGTKSIGRMVVGNKNGLLVPSTVTDEEMDALKAGLPADIKIAKVDEKLSALGNCIVCNDRVALVHPELDPETEATIAEVLNVEVYKQTIAGNPLVGSYCTLSNNGGLTHPMCSVGELDELSTLLQIPLCAGTVNRGSDVIGAGLVANDTKALCGMATTATELSVIDAIFKLGDQKSDIFESEDRSKLFD